MIICPWCGSGQETFQTPCARCGGPIQAQTSMPAQVLEEEITLPPKPPREIADSYRWKLMRTDAWCQAAFVFALLGAIFTLLGFALTIALVTAFVGIPFLGLGLLFLGGGGYVLYWRSQEAMKAVDILRHGEAVIGQITQTQINTGVEVNGRNPVTITYKFQAGGGEYQGTVTTLNFHESQFPTGKPVCVLYLPEAPQYSSMYPHP